jgi:hypothetical protein
MGSPHPDHVTTVSVSNVSNQVRDVGLRFTVHCPFELTSSRDDVHDNLWNRFLRDALPALFVRAVASQPADRARPAFDFLPPLMHMSEPFWQPCAQRLEPSRSA